MPGFMDWLAGPQAQGVALGLLNAQQRGFSGALAGALQGVQYGNQMELQNLRRDQYRAEMERAKRLREMFAGAGGQTPGVNPNAPQTTPGSPGDAFERDRTLRTAYAGSPAVADARAVGEREAFGPGGAPPTAMPAAPAAVPAPPAPRGFFSSVDPRALIANLPDSAISQLAVGALGPRNPRENFVNVEGVGLVDVSGGAPRVALPSARAPNIQEFYDDSGAPYKAAFNAKTGQWDRVGGVGLPRNQPEIADLLATRDRLPPDDPRRAIFDARISKLTKETGRSGTLTMTQERTNEEIDMARQWIEESGLDRSEILRRSQKQTDTGRDNPNYDPYIARQVGRATRKKYGDDPDYASTFSRVYGGKPQGGEPAQPQVAELPRSASGKIDDKALERGKAYTIQGRPYRWNGLTFDPL